MRISIVHILFIILALAGINRNLVSQGSIRTVVIDAGHGGKDPGALGKSVKEKDIALAVALKTGQYIEENFPDVKVIYTRKTDVFVDLYKRGEIANKANADLFISIHCNANNSSKIYGSETYVLGVEDHREQKNMKVAMMENAAILLEENAEENYGGFNPTSPESMIGLTLLQNDNLVQSLNIAGKIQKQFSERVGRKDRSVLQAGFLVLWKTSMPSVLVELGYLTNSSEEQFLKSKKGQVYMASAIYRAFKEYKLEYEKENNSQISAGEPDKMEKATNEADDIDKDDIIFKVQFYTSPRKLSLSDSRFKNLDNISYYEHNGLYKYTAGSFKSEESAVKYQKTVRSKGFSDAFVVPFIDGKRVSMQEARQLVN